MNRRYRARRDGTVFIQPVGQSGADGPGTGRNPAGWVARLADGRAPGRAVAAERRFEDAYAVVREAGLPGRRSVCLQPVADLPAARREVHCATTRRLRWLLAAHALSGGAVATVVLLAAMVAGAAW